MASSLPTIVHSLLIWATIFVFCFPPSVVVSQQYVQPYDCVDPQNRGTTSSVEIGRKTTVCLYAGPSGNWNSNIQYKRFSVNLIGDQFSNYNVPGSYDSIVRQGFFNTNGTQIFAASQQALSFQRRYYDATTNMIFPYLTIIVDVVNGVVRGIAWDDACVFCEQSKCLPNTYNFDGTLASAEQASQPTDGCYFTKEACDGFQKTGNTVCDLNLHVVWTGTDIRGNVLMSSDSRFSAFPPNRIQEKVQGSYDSMVNQVGGWGESIKDTFGALAGN